MENKKDTVLLEQITTVYSISSRPIATSLLIWLIFVFILWEVTDHVLIFSFIGIVSFVSIIRLLLISIFQSKKRNNDDIKRWGNYYIAGAFAQGLCWGLSAILLVPENSVLHEMIVMMWLVGIIGGVVSIYSAFPRVALAYVIPTIALMIITNIIKGDTIHIFFAVGFICYMFILIPALFKANKSIVKSLLLNIELQEEVQERKAGEERYASLFEGIAEGIMIHDGGVILDVNSAYLNIMGYEANEKEVLIASDSLKLLSEVSREKVSKIIDNSTGDRNYKSDPIEIVAKRKNGSEIDLEVLAKPHKLHGKDVRLVSVRDISARKIAQQKLDLANIEIEKNNRDLTSIIDSLQEIFFRINMKSEITWLSPASEKLMGYKEEEALGKKIYSFYVNPESRNQFMTFMQGNNGVVEEWEAPLRHKSGEIIWMSINSHYFHDENGNIIGIEGTVRDISKRKEMEERLLELSLKDGLTGLANRRHFDEAIQREWSRAKRNSYSISIIMIDIDHFKLFNDTQGHQAGDVCLKKVSGALKQIVKRPGDLAARYGGEEMAVILPNTDCEHALMVAEDIRQTIIDLAIPRIDSEDGDFVTVSAGVSSIKPEKDNLSSILIKKADIALYEAKEQGRNKVVCARINDVLIT